jgi:hypothetical protein
MEQGMPGEPSASVRTAPRVLLRPIVSALATNRVEVYWKRHPADDIAGYNLYRGRVAVDTVKKGKLAAWSDNDPEYAQPQVVQVNDITDLQKLNEELLKETSFVDTKVDLAKPSAEQEDYRYAVHAYIVRAENKLGVESGPSPYALTLPSEPRNVFLREDGERAELKWSPSEETSVVGYHVYKLGSSVWEIVRVTDSPINVTTFSHAASRGTTRYWVVPVDKLGQEGQPSSPVWFRQVYPDFFTGPWHQ